MNISAHVVTKTLDGRIIERFRNGKLLDSRGQELDWIAAEMLTEAQLNDKGIYVVPHPPTPVNQVMDSYDFKLDVTGKPEIDVKFRPHNAFELKQQVNAFRQNVESGFKFVYKEGGESFNMYGSIAELSLAHANAVDGVIEITDYDLNAIIINNSHGFAVRLKQCINGIRNAEIKVFKEIDEGIHLSAETAKAEFYRLFTEILLDKQLEKVDYRLGNENGIA